MGLVKAKYFNGVLLSTFIECKMKFKTRGMEKGRLSVIVPILIVLAIAVISGITWLKFAGREENISEDNKILINCVVLADPVWSIYLPSGEGLPLYQPRENVPTEVGVYRFYLRNPEEPWTGTFELLDTIPLQGLGENLYFGKNVIDKLGEVVRYPDTNIPIDNALTIGYPSVGHPLRGDQNCIEGRAVVEIDQSKNEVVVLVHYWETLLRAG